VLDAASGFYRVESALGIMKALGLDPLKPGDKVVVSLRPEDVHLSEGRPEGENVWQGTVDQKVFLGEWVDFQVLVGERQVQARAHPSLRTPVGDPIFLRVEPEKCVALKP
jgi:iron(III) transport system ATP-binding protein